MVTNGGCMSVMYLHDGLWILNRGGISASRPSTISANVIPWGYGLYLVSI